MNKNIRVFAFPAVGIVLFLIIALFCTACSHTESYQETTMDFYAAHRTELQAAQATLQDFAEANDDSMLIRPVPFTPAPSTTTHCASGSAAPRPAETTQPAVPAASRRPRQTRIRPRRVAQREKRGNRPRSASTMPKASTTPAARNSSTPAKRKP